MNGPRGSESRLVSTEPSPKTIADQIFRAKTKKALINSITDGNQLPRPRHNNLEKI